MTTNSKNCVKCNRLHRARTQSTVGVMSWLLAANRAQMDSAKACIDVLELVCVCVPWPDCVAWP